MQAGPCVSDSGAQTLSRGRIGDKRLERENPAGNGLKILCVPENTFMLMSTPGFVHSVLRSWSD